MEEAALLEAYQLEIESNEYATENRVSHILFEAGADSSGQDLEQRILAAQAQLTAGIEFSDVAREFSDDVGSVPVAATWVTPVETPSRRKWKKP